MFEKGMGISVHGILAAYPEVSERRRCYETIGHWCKCGLVGVSSWPIDPYKRATSSFNPPIPEDSAFVEK